jgi:hypothetical protein
MSNFDTYDFMKSSVPQSVNDYTPFTEKQWDYKTDQNQGVYGTNSGMTQVTFDLNNMFDSSSFVDISDMYLTIPIIMSAAFSTGAAQVAPAATTANFQLLALKSGYQHLIHQMSITSSGKTVSDMQPFVNVIKHWKLLSSMSATDLKNLAPSLGLSETLDNERSVKYVTAAAATKSGLGLCNNQAFIATASADTQIIPNVLQNNGTTNGALQKRISKIVDASTTGRGFNNIVGQITDVSKLSYEFKPYFFVNASGTLNWYDVAIIPLKYINDYINKAGIVRRADLKLVIWINTGTCNVTVDTPTTADVNYGAFSSTFSNTLPYTVNHCPVATASGGLPATTANIVTSLSIAKQIVTSIGGVNLLTNTDPHPMASCRIYYSKIKLDPVKALTFVQENTAKEVVFENYFFNQFANIPSGGTFSSLVQSGVKNPIGLLVIPFLANNIAYGAGNTFNQYASPYDTSPATYAPLSLINLNVNLGNSNVLSSSYNYTYENFLQQIVSAESLTSSDIGVNVGLISQQWWEMNRVYYIDLARSRSADKESLRSISLSFTNNSLKAIDLMVFTIFLDKVTMNIETGIVIRD